MKLEKKERELVESVERGDWKSTRNLKKEIAEAKQYAHGTQTKKADSC